MKMIFTFCTFLVALSLYSQTYDIPFYPNGTYDDSIVKPEEVIGYKIGEKPINYVEVVNYISRLAEQSPLVSLHSEGKTHQGRKLYYMIVTSEENRNNLDEIKGNLQKLSDPRITDESTAEEIINNSPAIAFMMYAVHGNESSGTDASIQLLYQLAAGTDKATKKLLDDLVIIIYPMENPDGRERFIHQVETWGGKVRNGDTQSMPHSGVWPSARTNHYHFDLNRDWFILSQPESRARVKIIREWNPQLVVDAHEMGSFSSYLFNPPREPINPNMDAKIIQWWKTFAQDQAKAFDQYGWSYYTREWLEEWYPGYGSSYPSYLGAIAILYEQARTSGTEVKRPDGTTLTFAEAIHHQFVSSIANLTTTANNKKQLLKDFYNIRKEATEKPLRNNVQTIILNPGENKSRASKLVEVLTYHGIEVFEANEDFSVSNATNYFNETKEKFSKGSYIITLLQPTQPLINAIMEFETRMKTSFLKSERESIEKGNGTRLYEVSSWSLPLAYGIDAYVSSEKVTAKSKQVESFENMSGRLVNSKPLYGYLIKYNDDNAINALLKLFDSNLKVRSARKTFKIENNSYDRGTLLIRNVENPGLDENVISKIAEETGVTFIGVNTALSESGSDLGADQFPLLAAPKTALLTGASFSMYNYGAIRHLLDNDLLLRVTTLNANYFGRYDLRKYNVLIMPSYWGSSGGLKNTLGKSGIKKLKDWISDGGTLIAIGSSAAALADTTIGISKVKLKRQVLSKLDNYEKAYQKELAVKNISVDSVAIWEGKVETEDKDEKTKKPNTKKMTEQDAEARKFMPRGAIVKINLNEEHWLNFGVNKKLPALYSNNRVLMSKSPVQTAARLAEKNELRLSGLMWPEAKIRMEKGAYLTRESMGNGQIILFADEPNFRSYFEGTKRLLLNGILLGPGFGTRQVVKW